MPNCMKKWKNTTKLTTHKPPYRGIREENIEQKEEELFMKIVIDFMKIKY